MLALALPSIVTNVTTPLLGLVDVALTGHMGGAVYLAAIAVGGTMFNLLYWSFSFLRMSASGLTAQAWGAGDGRGQALIISRELWIAAVTGLLMILLSPWLGAGLIRLTDPSAGSADLAVRYFLITVWGAPAVLATYALSGWFLGRQNSRIPMWAALVTNLSNIGVSAMLVFIFGMKIEGVAIGTLSAQWIGVAVLLAAMRRAPLPAVRLREVMRWRELKRFFNVSASIFLRTMCLIAVTFWFTRVGAAQGNVVLAVNALLMQLFLLFSFVMDGFAFAAEALVGRYVGEGSPRGLERSVRCSLAWGLGLALLFTAVYFAGGEGFLRILSDDGAVVKASAEYAAWAVAIPLAGFGAFAWDGVYVGAILNRLMLISMGLAAALFFLLWGTLYPLLHNHGLWIAFLGYLLCRSAAQTLMWPRAKRRLLADMKMNNRGAPSVSNS